MADRHSVTPSDDPLGAAVAHLVAVDPIMAGLIAVHGPPAARLPVDDADPATAAPRTDPWLALVRAIVGQQLSTTAARSIYGRVLAHFPDGPPTPQDVIEADPEVLRAAGGLSRAKVTYMRSLAEHVLSGELELDRIDELDDDTVLAELCAVKGIGEWTAHMFLMFQLGRPDILAAGDLGVRKGMQLAYGMDALPSPALVHETAAPWAPYRTAGCLVLWRSLDDDAA